MCFGAVGLLGGAQDLAWPYLAEIQKQAALRIGDALQWSPATDSGAWLARPDWYPDYAAAMAVVRCALALGLIVASVWLIQARAGADRWFIAATGASAVRNLVAACAGVAAGSVFSFLAVASGIVGFLLDVLLGVLCLFSNRKVYRRR